MTSRLVLPKKQELKYQHINDLCLRERKENFLLTKPILSQHHHAKQHHQNAPQHQQQQQQQHKHKYSFFINSKKVSTKDARLYRPTQDDAHPHQHNHTTATAGEPKPLQEVQNQNKPKADTITPIPQPHILPQKPNPKHKAITQPPTEQCSLIDLNSYTTDTQKDTHKIDTHKMDILKIETQIDTNMDTQIEGKAITQKVLPHITPSLEHGHVHDGVCSDDKKLSPAGTGKAMSDCECNNRNAMRDYSVYIDAYLKQMEDTHATGNALQRHEITPNLRSRMIDWMIEVLTNFKCNDLTFFLSVRIMDRYCKNANSPIPIADLHLLGVTAMFLASKFEDIYPLRMQMVYDKIGHKKLSIQSIKSCEHDILVNLDFIIAAPTSYEFLKSYSKQLFTSFHDVVFIERMAIYLAKMDLHDYEFLNIKPSLAAAGALYVSLKICEQLKKTQLIDRELVDRLCLISGYKEDIIIECAQKVLYNAQNFETLFPGLENLKKTHFVNLTNYLSK